ncbi:GNAT family [Colletotrichum sojae]|uniref:GNAT family n=1 Tax=Colletotrichum sojae TaxID=2175907 RepID=A0A8H6INV1_9PEZI|nr:GNAT family [Colletotrichum sojae]
MQASHLQPQEVSTPDAESLVRDVDFPAMQDGSLYRFSFNLETLKNDEQREEIIAWYIEGLEQAIDREKDHFRQIRNSEGRPIAFCDPPLLFNIQANWAAGLTFVSVHPSYQRRGLGSRLLQWFCEETDKNDRFAYVLASPEGVPLYRRLGFEIVSVVPTSEGNISSMLRQPHGIPKAIEAYGIDMAKGFGIQNTGS